MKLNYILVFCLLFAGMGVWAVRGEQTIPDCSQLDKIQLTTNNEWKLRIRPDGSAKLNYGSSGMDEARAPAQSFSFQNIYNLVVPHLVQEYKPGKTVAVVLHIVGQVSSTAFYLEDKAVIKAIMTEALDKSVPLEKDRFEELLKKYPPISEDAP